MSQSRSGPNTDLKGPVCYRFGEFSLEPEERLLRRGRLRVALPPKALDLLVVLVRRHGHLVEKEELMQLLWPGAFVEEANLSYNMSVLRRALADERDHPSYVETVPKRGYRFVHPVREVLAPPPPGGVRRRWIWASAGFAATAALAAALLWPGRREPPPPTVLEPMPLTGYPGAEIHPSFSPDGTQVAFAWNGANEAQYDVFVTLKGGGRPLQLTFDRRDDVSPAWSPDGQWIAFVRRPSATSSQISGSGARVRGYVAEVLLVPALGGRERRLGEIRVHSFDTGPYLSWARHSNALIAPDRPSENEPFGLFVIDTSSGSKRRLTSPGGDPAAWVRDSTPSVSPDGRTLAFARVDGPGVSEISVMPLTEHLEPAGPVRRVTSLGLDSRSPAWTGDGKTLVFSSGPMVDRRTLWRVPPSGDEPARAILLPSQMTGDPAIAGPGPTLAYVSSTLDRNVWRVSLSAPSSVAGPPVPLFSSSYTEKQPRFSPDGHRIALGSGRSGSEEIWVCDVDGGNWAQLTSFGGPAVGAPNWSPDGRLIAFDAYPGGAGDIYVIPSDGGPAKPLTSHPSQDMIPSWSLDGEWVYFISNRGGAADVWKIRVSGSSGSGSPIQLTRSGGAWAPLESRDGKYVLYAKTVREDERGSPGARTRKELWMVPRGGGPETKVIENLEGGGGFAVGPGGLYFLASTTTGNEVRLMYRPDRDSRDDLVTTFAGAQQVNHLAISPDGRSILYTQEDVQSADVMLVDDFR